jgi:DNA-directed RNA polymerase specialized sigma24 family protein
MVEKTHSRGVRWRLSQTAFDALLASLDADRVRAGEQYERLRQKLVKFFEWRGAVAPEDLADETLNRVARKIESGEEIRNVAAFCSGVARLVWHETLKERERTGELAADVAAPSAADPGDEEELRLDALELCLGELPGDHRAIVLEYYAGERRAKIDHRKELARRLGIEVNALRIRVHRIRARLESCVKQRLKRPSTS